MRIAPVKRNVQSLSNLWVLLKKVNDSPADFRNDAALSSALKSQHGLAKYESVAWDITATSLNTQKRIGRNILPSGYSGLDLLRCEALKRLQSSTVEGGTSAKRKRTVAGLIEAKSTLENDLSVARQDCFHLSIAFMSALSEGSILAADFGDESVKARWLKVRRELLARVTLSSRGLYENFSSDGNDNGATG